MYQNDCTCADFIILIAYDCFFVDGGMYCEIDVTHEGSCVSVPWFRLFLRENTTTPCRAVKPKPFGGLFGSQRAASMVQSVGESAKDATLGTKSDRL